MKKSLALLLVLILYAGTVLPCFTLGANAAGTGEATAPAGVLYAEDFDTDTEVLSSFNSDNYADWKLLSGSADVRAANGVLEVTAGSAATLQLFAGAPMNALAKEDYTLSFDMTYTFTDPASFVGVRLNYAGADHCMEVAVRLRGDGWVRATSGGTAYSLEDDGLRATKAQVISGTYNKYPGHMLLSLANTSTAEYAGGKYTYTDRTGKTQVTRRVYTAPLKTSGDVQLRARAYRDGVYSEVRVVNFATGAELAVTEMMCNTKGVDTAVSGYNCDHLEGFEVVNLSRHSIDLADYTFWGGKQHHQP